MLKVLKYDVIDVDVTTAGSFIAQFDKYRDECSGALIGIKYPGNNARKVIDHMHAIEPGFPILVSTIAPERWGDIFPNVEVISIPFGMTALKEKMRALLASTPEALRRGVSQLAEGVNL